MASHDGVGVNLRLEHIDAVLETNPNISHFEVIADNWLSEGPHHQKLEKIRERYPVYFHCVGMNLAGVDPIDFTYLNSMGELIRRFQPVHVSDHLCVQAHNGVHFHDLLPFPKTSETLVNTTRRVEQIQNHLDLPLVIENLSYYVEFQDDQIPEGEFIQELCQRTGSYILLDLNNIWVNEQNLDVRSLDYLQIIPIDRVKEIHIAGAERVESGVLVDTHGAYPSDEVLAMAKDFSDLVPITYERDNNILAWDDFLLEVDQINGMLGK